MANYTSTTSDKLKGKAIRLLFCGGIGLHYFYVGRIKAGFVRFLFGVLFWVLIVGGAIEHETAMVVTGVVFLVLINLIDWVNLLLGKFKDNAGTYLRE